MASSSRPRVFLDVDIDGEPAGRLTIELFDDKTPKTCENFRQLCTGEHKGLSYARAPFHRVINEFMVQGGDILKGDGTGTASIYGEEFEDENLEWRDMDAAGLVCSANRGKDTNGSQFFITLEPCEHLNGKHTILGRLASGEDTLQRIAAVNVDKNDRPTIPVLISRCGELERRSKKPVPREAEADSSYSTRNRGRRRTSDSGDAPMENSPEPNGMLQRRRPSDKAIDEGIRGRPRQRSGSRSQARTSASPSDQTSRNSSTSDSATRKHKRKRSPSPSRHTDHPDYERRRRSLPNQYAGARGGEDELRYRPSPRRGGDQTRESRKDEYRRYDDRYRPARDRRPGGAGDGYGRLGGGGEGGGRYDDRDPPVKFKGRGVMKYREPGRL